MNHGADAPLVAALNRLGVAQVRPEEPLARHTTFGIGGPATVLVEPSDRATLVAALELLTAERVDVLPLGLGSNLLVADAGFQGAVVKAVRGLRAVRVEGERLYAEAGVPLKKLCTVAGTAGLAGLEFAISIPGSVGGAVTMNAGAHGSSMEAIVEAVTLWVPGDGVVTVPADAMGFRYRWSRVQAEAGLMVLEAVLALRRDDPAAIHERMQHFMAYRMRTQPVGERNAGSMFKNPPAAKAGALIEQVGAKGWREGGAHISELHANFIINEGNATARDVLTLMRRVRRAVRERFGTVLRPEVRWVGPPAGEAGTTWDDLWLREDDDLPAFSG
jgi:UDP-N-acetylmuramate dehydrogenase